jgi:hypothetical protein
MFLVVGISMDVFSCRNFHGCFLLEENLVVLKPVLDTLDDATFTGNPYPLVN